LADLWHEFIKRNTGFSTYVKCNCILEKIYSNQSYEIDLNWKEQAYINLVLSKVFRIHDGRLFSDSAYPNNTRDIYRIVEEHMQTFDLRF